MFIRLSALLICAGALAFAKKPVTVEIAASTPEASPAIVWSPDSTRFVWKQGSRLHLYDVRARKESEAIQLRAMEDAAARVPTGEPFAWKNRGAREEPIQWFPTGHRLLLLLKGDLFVYDLPGGKWRQLTKTAVAEADPKVSPDGRRVSFIAVHDLYVQDVETGRITRLTHGGTATVRNGELDWVYPEELALGTAYWWSPDSRAIAYLQFDLSKVMIYPHADVTGVRPVAEPQRYPQAGTPNPSVRLGVVAASGGRTKWLDSGAGPETLLARVTWMADSARLAAHLLTRLQDRLTIAMVDPNGGKPRTLFTESAKEWINLADDFRFLSGGRLLIGSDADGWRHLYLRGAGGSIIARLTKGEWEVTELACVNEKAPEVFYLSTAAGAAQRQLYRAGFDGGEPERLTQAAGTHQVSMSPDCAYYVDTHSSLQESTRRTLHSANGREIATIAARNARVEEEYELIRPELLRFRASDGTLFDARLTRPASFDRSKKYPAIVMVYGGPHSQTVRDTWRGADWDQALAHRGFVVWQMDNRGSAGHGHLWETPLYRRLGEREMNDQLEGVRYLVSLGFVDRDRIGLYGWSYGGFMTLYSMLNSPPTFRAGIAGAPVTDWRNYDTVYTERYLGLPQENEDGYKKSSPIHYAAQLKGKLMLALNYEDDNVLFQHTFRMTAALQKEGKHFDLLLYPQKTHGVTGPLRKHMLEAMTAFFERELN